MNHTQGHISLSSKSKFSDGHKHPRRSHRPIIAKGPKGARLQKEAAKQMVAKVATITKLDLEKLKRLRMLHKRHESAGRVSEAAAVKEQIDAMQ